MATPFDQLYDSGSASSSGKPTLTFEVYHKLRTDIVLGRLKPNEKLRTEHLKKEYDASAATIREALALLVADTLVVSQQQRGFRVAPMSFQDFEDITETRALLESNAVRLSVMHGGDEWEAELSASFHLLSRAEERLRSDGEERLSWEECNKRFHDALVAGSGSRWSRHFLSILQRQSERYRTVALRNAPRNRDLHAEHAAIFRAAMDRDHELAGILVRRHIEKTRDIISQLKRPDGAIIFE